MKRVAHLIFTIILLTLSFSRSAFSWDGYRKGFILGFGAGFGSLNFTQELNYFENTASGSESHFPFFTNFKIGGAPTDQIMIYWSSKVSWFPMVNALNQTVTMIAGTGTIAVSYYWKSFAPSWFISGGLGYGTWQAPFEEDSEAWIGTGLMFGVGYEFSPHWSFEGGFNWGNPKKSEGAVEATTTHKTIFITINVLGY